MRNNNSDEREFELNDDLNPGFDLDEGFDESSIEDIRERIESEGYRRSFTEDLEKKYTLKTEDRSLEPGPIEEHDPLDIPDAGKFDVTKGKAADVAYLAWQSDGPVTALDIQMESWRPESRPGFLTKDDAEQGLRALAHAGLVRLGPHEYRGGTEDLYTGDLEEGFTDTGKLNPDSSSLGPLRYRTGREEQLRAPLISGDEVISDPERAFQEVGQMQEEYEFARDWHTGILGAYSPEY